MNANRQCDFGSKSTPVDRCPKPATRQWAGHWFCDGHGGGPNDRPTCAFHGCDKPATQNRRKGRITAWVCDEHAKKEKPNGVIETTHFEKPSTGSKTADRAIDRAIDGALIRIKPFLRDILREEIKRMLPLEED